MRKIRAIIMTLALLATTAVSAQISSVHGTVSDDMGPLMGATVCEIDATGRIIESAVTDLNGNFTMKIKNPKDKLRVSYVGMKTQTMAITKTTFNINMSSATELKEVVVKSKKRATGNGLPIPEREISYASQTISMKEFEGLGITSVDEALQGRIAGLDIVANSGNLGAGTTMRLRGASSVSSLTSSNPLIVVDGNIREVDLSGTDLASSDASETFSQLLNINPEDIASITVKKDAAATAVYGSQGGNGVIEITTKRGAMGKPKVSYSLKLTGTYQPKGYELLSGDDYTMLMKEAYFNPKQDESASNINELSYDPNFAEYQQYNNNTDWVDAVKQWGLQQNHYVNVSGGGEKATFRIGAGYDHLTGQIIGQKMNRFSTRVALDYNISQRIRVSTNFSLTYTKNDQNSDDMLRLARIKMPNMTIYQKNPDGSYTDRYYTMLQSGSSIFNESKANAHDNQKGYVNPVASANLAKNERRTYDMSPELIINYQLLGLDEDHWQLNWRGSVYMNIFNQYDDTFYPQELRTVSWQDGVNSAYSNSQKSVSFNTKQTLTLIPAFKNKDHAAMIMGRFELTSTQSSGQNASANTLPSGGITSPDAGGIITGLSSWYNDRRSMFYTFSGHYAYKERYVADVTLRVDGTTKFGPGERWGYFPSASLKWIVSDEPFMQWAKPVMSMFAIRPGWGYVGTPPTQDYLYTSKYVAASSYLGNSAMIPENIRLTDLKWESKTSYNLGIDMGFFEDRLNVIIDAYVNNVTDRLVSGYRVPSSSGYAAVPYRNSGKTRDSGWEIQVNTNRLVKIKDFGMDLNFNFGNNRNEVLEMDEFILKNLNSTYTYKNAEWLRRVQLNNPLGAIYGFRSLGVYQYTYDYVTNRSRTFANTADYRNWLENDFLASGKTAPIVLNENGKPVYGSDGLPRRMMFNYTNDGTGKNYSFNGGDARYEDVNHDGQIDALDIVYLGSSLPKLYGGFGFTFTYGDWRLNTQFTYRLGNKILNLARLRTEAMVNNDNQSQAVNYRWRKNGDITTIPRAMYDTGNTQFNTLVSDRFVESGDYLRMGYASLSYAIKKKYLTWIGLNRINLTLSAQNLFVITKYSGVDPDIVNWYYNPAMDNDQTPRPRKYTLSMTVDF